MTLLKFYIGQRVKVKHNVKYARGIFNNYVGTITALDEISPDYPYRVTFDCSALNDRSVCSNNAVFKGNELSKYIPTDIMEYLKDRLLRCG